MAKTIRELIAELSTIENQEQPIIYEYLLAENFEYADGTPSPTPKQFGKVIDKELSSQDFIFANGYELLNDIVYDVMRQLPTTKKGE